MVKKNTPPWYGLSGGPIIVACQWNRSSPTGPALHCAGGSLPRSCSSLLILFNAICNSTAVWCGLRAVGVFFRENRRKLALPLQTSMKLLLASWLLLFYSIGKVRLLLLLRSLLLPLLALAILTHTHVHFTHEIHKGGELKKEPKEKLKRETGCPCMGFGPLPICFEARAKKKKTEQIPPRFRVWTGNESERAAEEV